MNFEALSRCDG